MKYYAILVALLAAPAAQADDISWSGFGTLGYARSDHSYAYDRFLDSGGTFKRDSLFGLQGSYEFTPKWSATLQATLAPSGSDDNKWEPKLQWAFLSYRADNDLLLRAGKMRMPMYLFSENMNVGASYSVMHLPTEVYSTAPTTDYTGASFSKTWTLAAGDLSLDGYAGRTSVVPRVTGGGAAAQLHTRSAGLVLSLRHDDDTYRVGVQRALIGATMSGGGFGNSVAGKLFPVTGSTMMSGASDGAVTQGGGDIDTRIFLLGADVGVGADLRLIGEYARRHAPHVVTSKNSQGAYLTLLRKAGPWTPYVTVARLLTDREARQSGGAGGGFDDQASAALGVAYALSPSSKLKAEWMRVRVGAGSSLIDTTSGAAKVQREGLNVLSLSYSVAF
ncbi:MAG: hypothetical protein V4724_38500 [Pseudomonadota bacterium]